MQNEERSQSLVTSAATPQPPSLWSRQPDESAEDYQIFAAWLQLPVPRPARRAAATTLRCSMHRLRHLFARHRWKLRTAAFDTYRAHLASEAIEELLRHESLDWRERAESFREQEWSLHEQMVVAAREAVREFRKHPRRASLTEIARLVDQASVLGRRATGLPLDPASVPPAPPSMHPDWEEALRKVYGSEPGASLLTAPSIPDNEIA